MRNRDLTYHIKQDINRQISGSAMFIVDATVDTPVWRVVFPLSAAIYNRIGEES